jgi:hypothetical protein
MGSVYGFHLCVLNAGRGEREESAVLGLATIGTGRLAVYGDSSCLDNSHMKSECYDMLFALIKYVAEGEGGELIAEKAPLVAPFGSFDGLPQRRDDYNFTAISYVLQHPLKCRSNTPLEFQGASFPKLTGAAAAAVARIVAAAEAAAAAVEVPTAAAGVGDVPTELEAPEEVQHEALEEVQHEAPLPVVASYPIGGEPVVGQQQPIAQQPTQQKQQQEEEEEAEKLSGGELPLPKSASPSTMQWLSSRRLTSVQVTQLLSVAGGVFVAILWSVQRRRRAAGSKRGLLPTFLHWRGRSEERDE